MKKLTKENRNTEKPVQKYRFWIQAGFALLCVWIGIEFHFFVESLSVGNPSDVGSRPPGVEGFLPISALMSLYYFFLTGEIHQAHPAGFVILVGIISVSLIFGKAFCSWMCPVGFLSELIGDFGDKVAKKLFKKRIKIPKILDYPLRSIKYLLLAFFVYSIFFAMTAASLKYFLDSPYNLVADVKMYLFFADISRFSLIVIAVLFGLSIIFRNFWCRYLCPYGALLGITSLLSPNKIKRDPVSCIDCGLCNKACPSFIKVDSVKTVFSDECSTCMNCVDACPVKDTLQLKTITNKTKISKKLVAFGIVAVYIIIIGFGIVSGNWQNNISKEEYLMYQKNLNSLGHPRSTADIEKLNKLSNESSKMKE
ncbi:MAG: 4Fe-4S binding protein [Melioribacteraceae bacterium]|nr:4Fe-4S binding protein [Melioribacteraceae bacterium]MCF8354129.1 4Fe-4S binding protein [Melioribacteraceae bacterium]MCF8393356.1 4Fe-4S binding protein [Melioribacteraceae bacterium]MCF8418921.1 4Fe-4S binding protein [Melioribacteraceae bacterium]